MAVHSLATTNFRNLKPGAVAFGPSANIFHGGNGSGKTNLLEAIFTACLARSQRGAADVVLLNEAAEYYRLEGNISARSCNRKVAVAYQRGGRKKITIDTAPARASELFELSSLVAAGPEDSEILSGPPSTRRLFLDLYLSMNRPTYLADLNDYQKALAQKNAALKQEIDPTPFDPLLIKHGSRIMLERASYLSALGTWAVRLYARVTDGEELVVEYEPRVPFRLGEVGEADIAATFEAEIARNAKRELAMQTSLVGPHRDEIKFSICGLPARTHGSQGQWRAAAVALKLAVYELLREKRGEAPVLLLDEIFAELDTDRAHRLMECFGDIGQVFLTTAVEPPEALRQQARRFQIRNGEVIEE